MDLHYEVSGNGEPVILLHSGGADLRDWTFVTPFLAEHFKVITFDGRGVGNSPDPSGKVNYVEDLKNLLDYFELEKVMLVGHSMGGQIATDFTLEYPQRVSKLILIAPALSGYPYSNDFGEYIKKINEAAPNVDRMMELSLSAPSYQVVMDSPQHDLMVQMQRDYLNRIIQWPAFEMIWPQPPTFERLTELPVETLFIIGEKELPDNQRVADCFRKVPSVRVIEILNGDHMVTLTHPAELSRLITDFMEDECKHAANTNRE
ncbi:alpha/beta fold hydrolase [Pseudalkalibacillus sp. R45]|uniref:alpha/beta fold hydrolase n=1 Tax=Pseudalkalibacillus sp. R45 TaxID=3457433 RepID=UPI003FCC6B51